MVPSALFVLFSLPLILGLIPCQGRYGVRTKKTLSDDVIWTAANRFAGWMLLIAGLAYLVAAWFVPCLAPCGREDFGRWLVHLASLAAIRAHIGRL